jgi:predicted nucleic acid-binding protein
MQRIRIIITYLMLWTKFALNDARLMKFEFWGAILVMEKLENGCSVLLITNLSQVAELKSRYAT